jgi:A/G-specific adenine glycosylase
VAGRGPSSNLASNLGANLASHLAELGAFVAHKLEPWFLAGHRDMSWRRTRDPYGIWVSEIMLQQTRVETVERYWSAFIERFPSVQDLAAADEESVLEAWSGLGYYRRARLLHRGARYVAADLDGHIPKDADALRKIPGVGRYTAGAIASIAFDQPVPLVDGNVARVFSRLRSLQEPKAQGADAKDHWTLAQVVVESGTPRIVSQALMELGAVVCTPKSPQCLLCPLRTGCVAHREGTTDRIPAPRKKVEQPVTHYWAVAIISRKRLLMVRRPGSGLLAKMWCLPLVEVQGDAPSRAGLKKALGVAVEPGESLASVRHVFSHRIWDMVPVVAKVPKRVQVSGYEEQTWVAPGERPSGGVPSATEKLLATVGY